MASFVLAKKWAKNWLSRKKCFVAKKSGQLANFAKKSGQKICQFFGQKSGKNGIFGLFLGLKMPNLNWTSEITPIKQSAGVMIALFSGFGYTVLLCAGYMLLNGWKLGFVGYMSLFGAVTLALCAVLYFWLKKRGCNLFAASR